MCLENLVLEYERAPVSDLRLAVAADPRLAVAAAGYKRVLEMTASAAERRNVMYGQMLDEWTVGAAFDASVNESRTFLRSLTTRFPDCEAKMGLLHDPDLLDASSPPTPPLTGKWMGEEGNCI